MGPTEQMHATERPLAVVTGASSGIGRAIAAELATRGHDLVIAADGPGVDRAAEELGAQGTTVLAVATDLGTPGGVLALTDSVATLGAPQVLVLNAGVGDGGPFVEAEIDRQLEVIAVNVNGTVHLAHRLLPRMIAAGGGHVLVTSSIAATVPGPYQAVYHASKAFLQSFAEALRVELIDHRVSVTALMPGPTDTLFFDRARLDGTRVAEMSKDDPADVAREGVDAMFDGADHVVAGSVANRLQAGAAKVVPAALSARAAASLNEPGGAEDG